MDFQRELFFSVGNEALVLPQDEPLNPFRKPDSDIRALPPSSSFSELQAMAKSFRERFDSIED